MQDFVLSCLESKVETNRNVYARFVLAPFFKGHALTVGTAVRRALLSSVESIGIIALYIQGITHEFSTVVGVRESVLELSLNFQKVVLSQDKDVVPPKSFWDGVQVGYLHVQGPRVVYANDLQLPLGVELVDPTQYIATLSTEGSLVLKFLVAKRGLAANNQAEQHRAFYKAQLRAGNRAHVFYPKGKTTPTPCKILSDQRCHAVQGGTLPNKKQNTLLPLQIKDCTRLDLGKQDLPFRQSFVKQSNTKTRRFVREKSHLGRQQKDASNGAFYKAYFFGSSKVLRGARNVKACKSLSYCKTKPYTLPFAQNQAFKQIKIEQKPIRLANSELRLYTQSTKSLLSRYLGLIKDNKALFCKPVSNKRYKKRRYETSTTSWPTRGEVTDSIKLDQHSILTKNRIVEALSAQNISKAKTFNYGTVRPDICLRNVIPLDSFITPVNKVNFVIEADDIHNQLKERLILEVWTDGSIHPRQAVHEAALSLIEMFSPFRSLFQLSSYSDFSLHPASSDLHKHKLQKEKRTEQGEKMVARSTKLIPNSLSSFVKNTSTRQLKTKTKRDSLFFLYKKELVPSIYKTRLDRLSLLQSDIGESSLNLKTLSFLKKKNIHKLESLLNLSQIDLLHLLNGNKQMFYDIKRFLLKNGLTLSSTRYLGTRV